MPETVEKMVTVFGNEIPLTIPTQKALLNSTENYSNSFDLGNNLVLHVNVQLFARRLRLESNYITTEICTKEDVYVSKHETGLVAKGKLFERLHHEIDRTIGNIQRDFSFAHQQADKIFSSLRKVSESIKNNSDICLV